MSEEKEKPDWLNDFENIEATGTKPIPALWENNLNDFDIQTYSVPYTSPRFGRRSITGVKSVENSPKKDLGACKVTCVRSRSARPSLLIADFPKKLDEKDKKETEESSLNSSLQIIQEGFQNLNLCQNSIGGLNSRKRSFQNLEDSWIPLQNFNTEQKGRLHLFENEPDLKKLSNAISGESLNLIISDKKNNLNFNHEVNFPQPLSSDLKEKKNSCFGIVNDKFKKNSTLRDEDFIIPELPVGRLLVFNIKATWGDRHYVGLNGIEIFNSKGEKIKIESISADPPNINILPEYSNDPRVVQNLLDNVYLTKDDTHMWLAPFTPNFNHYIFIEFKEIEQLAMLRVWNYNKSRIHCSRGVKDLDIKLDDKYIFIGEIAKASGEIVNTVNSLGDTILFTTDENILELVAQNDEYFNGITFYHLEDSQKLVEEFRPLTGEQELQNKYPLTCPKKQTERKNKYKFSLHSNPTTENENLRDDLGSAIESLGLLDLLGIPDTNMKSFNFSMKHTTLESLKINELKKYEGSASSQDKTTEGVKNNEIVDSSSAEQLSNIDVCGALMDPQDDGLKNSESENKSSLKSLNVVGENQTLYIPSTFSMPSDYFYETISMPTGFKFTIQIHSTWGDLYYVGLNGLQVYDEYGKKIGLCSSNISAMPESVNVLQEIQNDARTPDKLIDGVNDTEDDSHMWLAPVLPFTINRIDLSFERPVTLSLIKLWNYAKTPSRGVREFGILVDGLLIYNGELEQVDRRAGNVISVPYTTVDFTNSTRIQNQEHVQKNISTSSSHSPDQSLRPFTSMTSRD